MISSCQGSLWNWPYLPWYRKVPFLVCTGGILVGGSGRDGLFALDTSIDAEARRLDADIDGDLAFLVATRSIVWAFQVGRAEARLVRVRAGD